MDTRWKPHHPEGKVHILSHGCWASLHKASMKTVVLMEVGVPLYKKVSLLDEKYEWY